MSSSPMDMSEFRLKWRTTLTYGGWCSVGSGYGAELLAHCGYDWIGIDRQHGMIDTGDMIAMLQGFAAAGVPGFVRVSQNDPAEIMKALDAGAVGVIVPMINSAEEATKAVAACRYPPLGSRSSGPGRAGLGVDGYGPERANREVICLAMIETVDAAEKADEIAAVPGLDGIFVGPGDLALSGGHLPLLTVEDDLHVARIIRTLEACRKANIVPAIMGGGLRMSVKWRDAGYRMIATSSDRALLMDAARTLVISLRAAKVSGR